MAIFELKILVTAVNKASAVLKKLPKQFQNIQNAIGLAALAYVGLKAAQGSIKFVKFGAQVEATESRFYRFAGSTSEANAMLEALNKSSDKTLDRMGAMATASQLMELGLADNAEEMGIAGAMISKLGRASLSTEGRMNSLTMLLANQSTRRLDDFGLSVERVKNAQKELEAQGLSTERAFKAAVYAEAAKKLVILGDTSELAATKINRVEASWKTLTQTMGKSAAEIATGGDALGWVADQLDKVSQRTMDVNEGLAKAKELGVAPRAYASAYADASAAARTFQGDEENLRAALEESRGTIDGQTRALEENATALLAAEAAAEAATVNQLSLAAAFMEASEADIAKRAIGELGDLLESDKITVEQYKQAVTETQLAFGLADEASIALSESVLDLVARFGEGEVMAGEFDAELWTMIDVMDKTREAAEKLDAALMKLGPDATEAEIDARQVEITRQRTQSGTTGAMTGWSAGRSKGTGLRRQHGGAAAGMTVVGERGWELLDAPPGSQVYNQQQSTNIVNKYDMTVNTQATSPSVQADYHMMQARIGA